VGISIGVFVQLNVRYCMETCISFKCSLCSIFNTLIDQDKGGDRGLLNSIELRLLRYSEGTSG